MAHDTIISDGSFSWEGGVDSKKVTTIQSSLTPNGLARNQLAWLNNATVRDGGISPRGGWKKVMVVHTGTGVYQGGFMYKPPIDDPYIVCSIGGHVFKVVPDNPPVDLSNQAQGSIVFLHPFVILQNIDDAPVGALESSASAQLGVYTPFTIPPVGQQVQVNLSIAYTGPLGITINLGHRATHVWHLVGTLSANGHATLVAAGIPADHIAAITALDITSSLYGTFAPGGPYFQSATFLDLPGQPTVSGIEYTLSSATDLGVSVPGHFTLVGAGTTPFSNFPKAFFCQAHEWLLIQVGDGITLPLIWDGVTLRRSLGITNTAVAPGTPGVNEIPAAGPMDFYMDRLWYSTGNSFSAGDITGGTSGTAPYQFRDAVLNVTENPLVLGGDGFATPRQEGDITALSHNATQDSALGQGRIFAFTAKGVHSLIVPSTRTDWINADSTNGPLMVPIQLANGSASDRSVTAVNGDLFYQSFEPAIRTIITAQRQFDQWGNIPVSSNEERILKFTDRSLLNFASGVYFDNRLIQTALPILSPQGCVHRAMIPLDFTPLSSFGAPFEPVWEGMLEGLDVLQLFTGVFDGVEKMFAMVVSRLTQNIELWELTKDEKLDGTDTRITWQIEFPAFTWGKEFELKCLEAGELWIDRLTGTVDFLMEYRVDGDPCWRKWHQWQVCSAANSCEDVNNPICYPTTQFSEADKFSMVLPKPPAGCQTFNKRPSDIGFQFQPRLTVKGFCRIRGILLHALPKEKALYEGLVC